MNLQETKVLNALYSCAAITKNSILKCGGDEDLIISLIDRKILKKHKIEIQNKSIAIYTLSKQGEKIYIEFFLKNSFYRCLNLKKAVRLSYVYFGLSEEERNSWISKDELSKTQEYETFPDAVFFKDGVYTGLSIIKKEDKDKKIKELTKFIEDNKLSSFKVIYYDEN